MAGFIPLNGQIGQLPAQGMDPASMAQLETDQQSLQRRQQLAQALMSTGYTPNSGKQGVLGSVLASLAGGMMQRGNNEKVTDLLRRQMEAAQQAAQAKHDQEVADLRNKTDEEIRKAVAEKKAGRDYAPLQFQASGVFDPSSGAYSPSAAAAQQEIGIKSGEAEAAARAQAKYREAPGAAGNAKMAQIAALMKQPDSPTKTAQLTSLLGEGGMQGMAMANMFGGGGGGGGGAPGVAQAGVSGDDFLKTLSPGIASQVKAIAEGRQAPMTGMAMRSPMGQALSAAVQQYDPSFDATNYQARQKAHNDFTSGKSAQALNAFNTAIGHAGELADVAGKLGNTSIPAWNTVANAAATATGDGRITAFNQTRDALVGEATRAFRGVGGNKSDIDEAVANLNAAASPEQQKASIGQMVKLLNSKANALNDQYSQAFAGKSAPNFDDPHVLDALKKMQASGIDVGRQLPDSPDAAPAAAKSAPTQTATNPKTGQKIGLVNGEWVPL